MKKFAKILGFLGFFVTLATAQIGTAWAVLCDPGQYLPAGSDQCAECPGTKSIDGTNQGVYCPYAQNYKEKFPEDQGLSPCRPVCGTNNYWLTTRESAAEADACTGTCSGYCIRPDDCLEANGCFPIIETVSGTLSCGDTECHISEECKTKTCDDYCYVPSSDGETCVPKTNKAPQYRCSLDEQAVYFGIDATYGQPYTVTGSANLCVAPSNNQEFAGWILTNDDYSGPYMPGTSSGTIASWPCVNDPVIFIPSWTGTCLEVIFDENGGTSPSGGHNKLYKIHGETGNKWYEAGCKKQIADPQVDGKPTKNNATFVGYYGPSPSEIYVFEPHSSLDYSTLVSDNGWVATSNRRTLYAHFVCNAGYYPVNGDCVANSYDITYICDNGTNQYTATDTINFNGSYKVNGVVNNPILPVGNDENVQCTPPAGNVFTGWWFNLNLQVYDNHSPIERWTWDNDGTFTATWGKGEFEITLDPTTGAWNSNVPDEQRKLYTIYSDGVYITSAREPGDQMTSTENPLNRIPEKTATVTFKYCDGDSCNNPTHQDTEQDVEIAFKGFYQGANFGSQYISLDQNAQRWYITPQGDWDGKYYTSSKTWYAQWDNGSVTLPTIPSDFWPGHTFLGWFTEETGGTEITSPYTVTDSITLYAHWEEQKIDVKYTCHAPENSSYNDTSYTYNDAATYGQEYKPVKSVEEVTTASNSTACQFAGYEIDPQLGNSYQWSLKNWNYSTGGKYNPGDTMAANDWQHISPTPETEIEFELEPNVWKAKEYSVQYRCGSIDNHTFNDPGYVTDDGAIYNTNYIVANNNILSQFNELCVPADGYTLQNWTFACPGYENVPEEPYASGANFGTWTYDSNNCYFTANWAQTDFVIILDQNGATSPSYPSDYLYTRLNSGVYLDSDRTKLMKFNPNEANRNPLDPTPKKTFNVNLYPGEASGASFEFGGVTYNSTNAPAGTSVSHTFNGFYQNTDSNPNQYIDSDGYITEDGHLAGRGYNADSTEAQRTWVANWTQGSLALPEPTAPVGYTYNGWSCVDGEGNTIYTWTPGNDSTPAVPGISENITCTAQWSVACRSVSFDENGGTSTGGGNNGKFWKISGQTGWYADSTCTSNATPNVENTRPTKEHATFIGYDDIDSTPTVRIFDDLGAITTGGENWTITQNATLYAQYECVAPYHLDTNPTSETAGQCVACAPGTFYDQNETDPAKQCKNCNQYISDNGVAGARAYTWTSKDPYNWSINQCYRTCDKKCTAEEFAPNHRIEQFVDLVSEDGVLIGNQVSFYGNEFNSASSQRFNACEGDEFKYCPQGLLAEIDDPTNAAFKTISAPVKFHGKCEDNGSCEELGDRYIVGDRGYNNGNVILRNGFAWSHSVGEAQLSNTSSDSNRYTLIIYPTDAPTPSQQQNMTFAGYRYPRMGTTAAVTTNGVVLDGAIAGAIITYAGQYDYQDMSPIVYNNNYTRNLYAQYTAADSYTLTYNCGEGGGIPPAQQTNIYAGNTVPISTPSDCGHYSTHSLTGWTVTATGGGENLGTVAAGTTSFTWNYDQNVTFTAVWGNANQYSITYENMTNATRPADHTTTMPDSYTYGVGATISGVPTRDNSIFSGWCTDSTLSNCQMQQTIGTNDSEDKTFWAKWECQFPYHLNTDGTTCEPCDDNEFWDGDSCESCPNGWFSNPPYNWSINQCYKLCDGSDNNYFVSKSCTYANDLDFGGYSTSDFLVQQSGTPKQIVLYGNYVDTNVPNVCLDDNVKYCPRVVYTGGTGGTLKLRESLVRFMKHNGGSNDYAGTRYIVGNRSSTDYDMFTDATKIWSHIVGDGQRGRSGEHVYTVIIYPTDTAPSPDSTPNPAFKGYFDGTGSNATQRVAAALGLDSTNAVAFPQSPLLQNQIGDRILYPQYCANGETWNGQSCTGNAYTVKYVCGDHGYMDSRYSNPNNTATYGEPYTVAKNNGNVIAECIAQTTGYVIKTNDGRMPVWKLNNTGPNGGAEHYTGEEIMWPYTSFSGSGFEFTAQYDCAAGYTWNADGTACVSTSTVCPAELSAGSHANIIGTPIINNDKKCVYTIQCELCHTSGEYGCYTNDLAVPTSTNPYGQFEISDDPNESGALDGVSCTPADFCVTLDDNGGNGGIGELCEIYGEGWHKYGSDRMISSLESNDLPTWLNNSQVFAGYWTLQNDGSMEIDSEGLIMANNTILEDNNQTWYAHWGDGTGYTVTFKCDGDTQWTETLTVYPTQDINVPQTQCLRTGYTFTNWVDTPHNVTIPATNQTFNWTGEFNSVLTPDWTANRYDVTYKCNEDDTGITDPTAAVYGQNYYVQPYDGGDVVNCAAPAGKVFTEWSLNTTPNATGMQPGNATWTYDISNPTFTAQWTDGCYKVTFNNTLFGGQDPLGAAVTFYKKGTNWYAWNDSTCTYPQTPNIYSLPTKQNAEFLGYDEDSISPNEVNFVFVKSGSNAVLTTYGQTWTITGDTTLYAKYDCDDDYTLNGTTCVLDSSNFHTITLDKNVDNLHGDDSNPNVLYTIEGTAQAYTDEEHNDPFYSLNENGFPRKYAKVTFHYCNGTNNSCDNPSTQNEIKDADFIFNGFYATTPASGQRYINSEGDMLPAGNTAAAAATTDTRWYADWNGYGTLEVSRWPIPNQSQTPAGYAFCGWYTRPECADGGWYTRPECAEDLVTANYHFTEDKNVYACWLQTVCEEDEFLDGTTCKSCAQATGGTHTHAAPGATSINQCYKYCPLCNEDCPDFGGAVCSYTVPDNLNNGGMYHGSSECTLLPSSIMQNCPYTVISCDTGYHVNATQTACEPDNYTITLDSQRADQCNGLFGGNDSNPTVLYTQFGASGNIWFNESHTGTPMYHDGVYGRLYANPAKSARVTFEGNGGTVTGQVPQANFVFGGFYSAQNGQGSQYIGDGTSESFGGQLQEAGLTAAQTIAGNQTWYAKWTGGSITLPSVERTGYTFMGWYKGQYAGAGWAGNIGDSYTPMCGTETLYAHWSSTPNSYNIRYHDDNAQTPLHFNVSTGACSPTSYNYGSTTNITCPLNAPTNSHAVFKGWCTNANATYCSTTSPYFVIGPTETGDKDYYALWECENGYHADDSKCVANTININYTTTCGTSTPSSATCTFNSGFNLATHSTSAGYTFNGWTAPGTNNRLYASGASIECTDAHLGDAVYTNNATVTITGSCASNDEQCPATLPTNANLNMSYSLDPIPNAGACTYHLQCASCIGSNDHDCYTRDGMNSDGTFTVTGPVGDSTALNNVRCEPATYTAVYKCGAGIPVGSYTHNVTITYNGSYTVLPNGTENGGVVTCSKDGERFNHWTFNLESGRQYTGGEQISPWRYHGATVPTFTAQYGPCPEGEVLVHGECKKECPVDCTWPNYPADPAPCPTPPYPAGTMCHYIAGTNTAYGYRPSPSSRQCLDVDTDDPVEAKTCNVDVTQDPTCPSHYHWNSGTFNCDPDVYTVTLDPNRESYQNNTIVPGSNNVNELKEKWEYGWSKDGGYQFATDSLILNTNTEVPYWTDGTKVFDGYWTTPSGTGYRMVQANGLVSQNGYQLLPATTITSDTTWYARYVDNPGPFTVTFRCDQDGAILNTQNPSFGDYIDVLAAPQSACTNHPGETFNQWRIVANGVLIPAWYNGNSGLYQWTLHEGSQIVPDWRPVYEVTLKKGATDAVPGSVTKLWNASGIGWFGNSDLTQPVSSPLTGSQLPTRQGYSFAGYFIEGTTPPPYRVEQNGNLPGNNVLTSNEVWVADWSQCEQGQYYDVETNSCLPCGSPYTDNPHAIGHEQCYYNCSEDCAWNDSIMTNCNIPHATQYAPVAATYSGQHFWGYNYCSLNYWSSPHPAQAIPACQCRVTECEAGWSVDSISNSCKENDHWSITLNPHLVNNTQGSYSSPRALYTWHGKGVYLYEDYSQYLMNGNQNPLVSNPQTFATVTFNLNGDGAWLDWENQRRTDPVDIDVPLTYLGFYKSETDSDMVINTNRYIEPAGTQAGKTATANLEWHAHWQPRQIGTVTGSQLPQPSRPGFNFVGWFNTPASNGGTQIYATTPAAQNMTVYARWSDRIYTVNLVSDGNNCQPSNNTPTKLFEKYNVGWNRDTTGRFDPNLTLTDDELPTPNAGYEFKGYYDALSGGDRVIRSDGRVEQEPNYTDDNHTWYARCGRPTGPFTITFRCDAGEDPLPNYTQSVQNGGTVRVPPKSMCSNAGRSFTTWMGDHNTTFTARDTEYTATWSDVYANEDFTPNWNNGNVYYVTLAQTDATEPGIEILYEKYDNGWGYTANGPFNVTRLSGSQLPRRSGYVFAGYKYNDVPMGYVSNGQWRLPDPTVLTDNNQVWEPDWSQCEQGEYWDGNKCYPCPYGFTDNPHAIGAEQCYGNCEYDCQDSGCPSPLPVGMQSCTPNHSDYPQWGIKYNRPGATCLPQGQQSLPICPNDIICNNGYDLVGTECRDNRYTITLDSNLYNGNGTLANPSTLYTWFNHGVYRDYNRTYMMTPNDYPLESGTPSTYATVTLNGNGAYFDWHNQYGPQLQDNVQFVFDGFYDITNATTNPVIGIDGYITADGQSIGMDTQSNLTWRAWWRNGSVDLPSISRDGYTFDGWWTECNGGTRVSMGDQTIAISGDITLCAHWSGKSYTVTYNCDSEGGQGGTATDSQRAYQNTTYTVRENFIPCHKDANVSNGTRYHEFENWKFNLNSNSYWPGDSIMWIFNADNPTFNAHYKECPNGWYFDGSCKQCPNGYTNSDIDADSASKCYKTCDVQCTQPTSQCPMNEEGVLTCTYPNNTYPLGKQYSGSDNCIYDGTAPACEPFTIMCKPGYTPDYYLSTDTGTHCTKLADHEITLDPNGGTGGQEKLYTTYNTGVYLDQARTLRMRLNQNYLTDLPEKTAAATFNYCDYNGANCDDNPTTRSVSVDLGLKGYYQTATNNTRYLEPVPNSTELKLRITDGGDTAGKSYQDNTHTWYAQWSPTAIGNSRWPANPANHTAQCKTYTFNNWWTEPQGGNSVDYNTEISENVTWYAHWCESCPTGAIANGLCSANNCVATFTCDDGYAWDETQCQCVAATGLTLTYQPNGGTPDADYTEDRYFGETFTTRGGNTYTKVGHIIAKWANVGVGGGSFPLLAHSYTYDYNGNTTLEPEWKQCTCTFNGNSGVESCDANIVTNNTCTPDVVCKPGYINGRYTCTNEYLETCSAQCDICPAGTYQNGDQCSPCTGNNVSAAGATQCEPCDPGYTANAEQTQCVGNPITINWDENGGNAIPDGSCVYGQTFTLANAPEHSNRAMQFLGWKLFMGDSTYSAGTNVMCTYDNVGVYSGTSTAIQAQWNECQCNYPLNPHVAWCQAWFADGECKYMNGCDAGYEPDPLTVYTPAAVCNPKNYNITYNCGDGIGIPEYLTDSATFDANYTVKGRGTCQKVGSNFVGWLFSGNGQVYQPGDRVPDDQHAWQYTIGQTFTAQYTNIQCASDEILIGNDCVKCNCTIGTGATSTSCGMLSTNSNTCEWTHPVTCQTGFVTPAWSCTGTGNTNCTASCSVCPENQVEVGGSCVDCECTPVTTTGAVSCGTRSVSNNMCNWGPAICTPGHHNPNITCSGSSNQSCEATCGTCPANTYGPDGLECIQCPDGYTSPAGSTSIEDCYNNPTPYTITYRPNGGVNPQTGNNQPVWQPVTYWADFTTLMGTTFTKDNHILTRWNLVGDDTSTFDKHQDPDTNQYYAKLNEYYDHYNTLGDTILDAHWEQCTCAAGNGVSSCTTSSTSENACACAGECAARYINGGCSCNGTSTCTQTCTECPAGYISNADQTECVICPENTYQSGNTCEQCPTGYTSPAGSTSIEDCYNNPVSYTVHYSSNNGLDQTETQPVTYGTTFTTLGGTTFTYDNHIMTRWNKISGGDYTELSHPYEYGVQEDTFLKAQWAQCTCATGNGVSSCTTSSTSENACACTGECAAGYVKGECSCSGNTCTQSCTKCADNQVEINGVCVDCSCSADGNGVVSGCGFVSNENNVCNWGTTTCDTGYNNPGDLVCTDLVHNNNCTATCTLGGSNAVYKCGTGIGAGYSTYVNYGATHTILTNAFVGCYRDNSTFAGWAFNGDNNIYFDNVGATVTWNYTAPKEFEAKWCDNCSVVEHGTNQLTIPEPGLCSCVLTCDTGYHVNSSTHTCEPNVYPNENGITYKPNGGTPNRNYTQSVTYDAPFTTLDWSVEHYTKAHHILAGWDVESGGVGTFNGGYAALGREYTYHTDGATVLAADWNECATDEISLNNTCRQCGCTNGTGAASCGTLSTDDDTCTWGPVSCQTGYVTPVLDCLNDTTNCTASCTPCGTTQVEVNGTCTDCVCNVEGDVNGIISGCVFVSNNGNTCNWNPTTCKLGYGNPNLTCDDSGYNNNCEASCTICDAGYYGPDGLECIQCPEGYTSLPGATSIRECFIDPNSCAPDEHIEHGECVSNTRACSIPNATHAARIWNPAIGTYGPCTVVECDTANGYHESGNACVRDTCVVAHGSAESEYSGGQWECFVTKCDPGYEPSSDYKSCVECANRYVDGDIAVSSYVSECEIAACMYQGQKYALQNGECVPICTADRFTREDPSNPTGTIQWDERTKKCIRTCKPGYKMW